MAQRKIDKTFSFSTNIEALRATVSAMSVTRGPDEDFVSAEYQRAHGIGPDYDPKYFEKLEALIEENYGPIAEYTIVNG